ncbi:MAG: polyprenyl synthetase family protein [Phycisphaerae bacterium]
MSMQNSDTPPAAPPKSVRPPQEGIPPTYAERERIRLAAREYVASARPVPPLSLTELHEHAARLGAQLGLDGQYRDFTSVLLNSEVWRDTLAGVPYSRRLLLLPKCLRSADACPASFDELGLVCQGCGRCAIDELQTEAEQLGYAVLCAEGSARVIELIQTGGIDAIIGISCLSVLEKAFPHMQSAGIPGVAIPLLQDGCHDTSLDMAWAWDAIHLTSDARSCPLDLDGLRQTVDAWFEPAALEAILGPVQSPTERIARDWLAGAGKRWRPFLTACTCAALAPDPRAPLSEAVQRIAVAVECFHKASLVHDDIEDGDELRYGAPTLHAEHGVPVALNVGDLLIGEGYRQLVGIDVPPAVRTEIVRIAAAGQCVSCLGQGAELHWARNGGPLSSQAVLDIFRQKTAPAFEVALRLGAAYAGATPDVAEVLAQCSAALGIAYQIRDDLDDLQPGHAPDDLTGRRLSLPLAVAYECTTGDAHTAVEAAWQRTEGLGDRLRQIIAESGAEAHCRELLDSYREEALRHLAKLENPDLRNLLRRVVARIYGVDFRGWCRESASGHAANRAAGTASAG